MEEQKENEPQQEPQPEPQQEPKALPADNPNTAGAQPAKPNRDVTLAVTLNGETTRKEVKFHTPTLLQEVEKLDDAATVEIVAPGRVEGQDSEVLLSGTKAECVEALAKSIVRPEHIVAQFQHLVRFLVDHSTLKAVGVALICTDDKGDTAGAGFVSTTPDCTVPQAIALVNCTDANMDEFIAKAKLDVPGRNGTTQKGIITPTAEEIRKLG